MAQRMKFGEQLENQQYIPRIAVYAVILGSQRSQVAVMKNERGLYFLPGGGMEAGEEQSVCLKRELIEETGYEISVGPYIGQAEQYHMSVKGEPVLGIGHFYQAELRQKVHEPAEEGKLTWLSTGRARASLFLPYQAWAIDAALRML